MDISLLIKSRMTELGLDQKDLAAAADVTESYISQLLAGKKSPPSPGRTDIYKRIGAILKLSPHDLSKVAELQRTEALRKRVTDPPRPLFGRCRELLLSKCNAATRVELRRIFEKEPFGELERLVTQTLLRTAHGSAQPISEANCISSVSSRVKSWNIDVTTFAMRIVIDQKVRRFEFVETGPEQPNDMQPGLQQFLKDKSLSADVTQEETEFLMSLDLKARRPSALYYYRELQSLRDPIHFR